jgi:hypothetical protein
VGLLKECGRGPCNSTFKAAVFVKFIWQLTGVGKSSEVVFIHFREVCLSLLRARALLLWQPAPLPQAQNCVDAVYVMHEVDWILASGFSCLGLLMCECCSNIFSAPF